MADVFISYNREDREVARTVANALEAEGFSVWWDAALRAGEYYEEVTEKNLRSAAAVVVLWSKRSAGSKWVRAEATVGERSSTLVPALIEECDRPVRFELLQTADLTRWTGDRSDPNWQSFVLDVREAASRRKTPSPEPEATARPFASAQNQDATIETTFWTSIKDGSERADFEAYIARYPRGHFVDLARNRIAAMERAAKPAPPPRPQAVAPQPRPAVAPARPAVSTAHKPAPTAPPAKSGSGAAIVFAGGAAALAAIVAVGLFMMRNNASPAAGVAEGAPVAQAAAPALPLPGEPPPSDEPNSGPAEPPSEATNADVFAEVPGEMASEADQTASETAASEALAATISAPSPVGAAPAPRATQAGLAGDCETCPLMALLPGGAFMMGAPEDEPGRNPWEGPPHEVIVKPFRIGAYEVTAGEWGLCVADGVCAAKHADNPKLPATRISWHDAKTYARWLSKETGKTYRLPSEAEWEYAARAGTASPWHWGDRFEAGRVASGEPKPVGSFDPNPFGLHDMLGNVREWVEDCYVNNFTQTPRDGSAARTGDCSTRVVRGGAWSSKPNDTRVANRIRNKQADQIRYMGFRIAADAE